MEGEDSTFDMVPAVVTFKVLDLSDAPDYTVLDRRCAAVGLPVSTAS